MEKRIKELYNDSILDQALERYGIDKENVGLLDGFESFIYEYQKDGGRYVLRVSHDLHRTSDMIQGELEWVNHLANGGVPAARAVPSQRGNLVEAIAAQDGSHFTAASFEWAKGGHVSQEDWNGSMIGKLGQIVGRMHALTTHFEPSDARFRRHDWDTEHPVSFAEQHLPATETKVIAKLDDLVAYLHTLPQDEDSYGLIHTDVHRGNFFVDDGAITLFDFDDSQYAWFVYDIAMALFYAISHDCVTPERIEQAASFMSQFMEGYRREYSLDPRWVRQIPYFLKLREMDLYAVIHRSFDLDNLDPWCASFMDNRKYKIENDVPYVELDWERWGEWANERMDE